MKALSKKKTTCAITAEVVKCSKKLIFMKYDFIVIYLLCKNRTKVCLKLN